MGPRRPLETLPLMQPPVFARRRVCLRIFGLDPRSSGIGNNYDNETVDCRIQGLKFSFSRMAKV